MAGKGLSWRVFPQFEALPSRESVHDALRESELGYPGRVTWLNANVVLSRPDHICTSLILKNQIAVQNLRRLFIAIFMALYSIKKCLANTYNHPASGISRYHSMQRSACYSPKRVNSAFRLWTLERGFHTFLCFQQAALYKVKAFSPMQSLGDTSYEPKSQDYFIFSQDGAWQPATPDPNQTVPQPETPISPKLIRLISCNIDFGIPFGEERLEAALNHLYTLVSSTPKDTPIIIFLQEMLISDLAQIQSSPWIQPRFHITDTTTTHWRAHYGTTTLIDNRLRITRIFRVPWLSAFGRDGLFIDIALRHPQAPDAEAQVLRLCNVHLESLVADPPIRPTQVATAARYLQMPGVPCALLAGDCNAIQPFDRALHSENDLKDVFLELGGAEDTEEGYTWGQQVPLWSRKRFGCSRMDKILYRGDVRAKGFERIGVGVMVAEDVLEEMRRAGLEGWVTDHYGVMGDFEVGGDWMLRGGEENK